MAHPVRPPVRLIVFDCDGTLVDSQATIVTCAQAAFVACGLVPPHADAIRRIVGLSLEPAMGVLLGDADDLDLSRRIAAEYRTAFFAYRARPDFDEPLFDGVVALLDRLSAENYVLGVATGKAMAGLVRVLEHHDLARYFVTLQTADLHPSKPHPAMLEAAMRETGCAADETVIVGDTTFDIEMGVRAGCRAIGVAYGNHPSAELYEAGAEHVMHHIGELTGFLAPLPAR